MPLVFEHGSDIGVRPVLVQPATLGVAAYANNLNKEVGNCFRGMSKARDGLRQAHMDVLVAVPGKRCLPRSARQTRRLEGLQTGDQGIVLVTRTNGNSQKIANSGFVEVPYDNALLPKATSQSLAGLLFVPGKDEIRLRR